MNKFEKALLKELRGIRLELEGLHAIVATDDTETHLSEIAKNIADGNEAASNRWNAEQA